MKLDRRTFLLGGTVAVVLPLAACGGGGGIVQPPVVSEKGPMDATATGVQFQTLPQSHALVVTSAAGKSAQYGSLGAGTGQLNYPSGVAVLNNLAYVLDTGNHRVQIFDANGVSHGSFGQDVLLYPSGIAAGKDEIFVADTWHGRIVAFTPEGRVTRIIGADVLSSPRGIAFADDSLLVADTGLRQVLRLGLDGQVLATVGDWVLPWDIASDGTYIYVADASAHSLAVLSLTGERLDRIDLPSAPNRIWVRNGVVYVV